MAPQPALSVVLLAQLSLEQVQTTVSYLRADDLAEQLELVVVTPEPADRLPYETSPIGSVTLVTSTFESRSQGYVEGIRAARAPLVVLGEDHAFPEKRSAAAFLAAHEQPDVAVVVPAFVNANPRSPLSWGNLVLSYGTWLAPVERGPLELVTVPNACFKRDVLLDLDQELEPFLRRDGDIVNTLRSRGFRVLLEPDARVRHLNPSRLGPTVRLRFHAGRIYGAGRAEAHGWSRARRLLYCLGAPLIPPLRLARLTRSLRRRGHHLSGRVALGISFGLALDAAGQAVGYARGSGDSAARLHDVELHGRTRLLNRRDRLALESGSS
jgi:hypothetical protein